MTGSTHLRVTLALVLAVSLAGCGATNLPFLDGEDADRGQGEAIAADSAAEMRNVSAYNFTMTQVVSFGQQRLNMTADGTVNHTSERLYLDGVQTVQTNTTRSKAFTEVYVLGDTRCRKDPTAEGGWNETQTSGAWSQGLSPASQSTILNASGTSATLLANETVQGERAYVVEIEPDAGALKRVVANRSGTDVSAVTVQNATITQYVAHDDNALLRSDLHVTFVQNGRVTTLALTMTYSDYDDVDQITVPTDATGSPVCEANATETVRA